MMIKLELQNPNSFESVPKQSDFENWANAAFQASTETSLVIRIVDAEEGTELNQQYRNKNSATNVLSFPYEVPDYAKDIPALATEYSQQYLGDLVLCESVVIAEAQEQEQGKLLQQHWAHLIVHGVLHLQGYDHIDDADATTMEALEITIMEHLGFDNPYAAN